MALAVYGNTPVISFDGNDACNFLLDEMICDSPEQFKEHLGRLANDPAYRSDVATRQMEHFRAGHTVDASCADLVRHFHAARSEEHTSELQSLMRISSAVFCLNTKINNTTN